MGALLGGARSSPLGDIIGFCPGLLLPLVEGVTPGVSELEAVDGDVSVPSDELLD